MTYQAILFDIDGTLTNSLATFGTVLRTVLKQYQQTASDEQIRRFFPLSAEITAAEFGFHEDRFSEFEARYQVALKANLANIELFPGIDSTLASLERDYALGIVTSQTMKEFNLGMQQYPFVKHLKTVITADQVTNRKPAPEPLNKALAELQLDPQAVLYVGDSKADELAADAAKIDFAVATWGADAALTFPTAKYHLKHPQDLLTLSAPNLSQHNQ